MQINVSSYLFPPNRIQVIKPSAVRKITSAYFPTNADIIKLGQEIINSLPQLESITRRRVEFREDLLANGINFIIPGTDGHFSDQALQKIKDLPTNETYQRIREKHAPLLRDASQKALDLNFRTGRYTKLSFPLMTNLIEKDCIKYGVGNCFQESIRVADRLMNAGILDFKLIKIKIPYLEFMVERNHQKIGEASSTILEQHIIPVVNIPLENSSEPHMRDLADVPKFYCDGGIVIDPWTGIVAPFEEYIKTLESKTFRIKYNPYVYELEFSDCNISDKEKRIIRDLGYKNFLKNAS